MAFPTVQARNESAATATATTHTVNLPTGITAGDLLIVIIAGGGTNALQFGTVTGWTELLDENQAFGAHVWCRQADGTEGATQNFTSGAASRSAHVSYRISGAENPATQAPQLSAVSAASTNAPNPNTVTPTGGSKDYLWITFFCLGAAGEEADDDTWVNNAATNYSNLLQITSGTGGTNVGAALASCERTNTAASEDAAWPAASTDQTITWRAFTIAVHPESADAWTATPTDNLGVTDSIDLVVTRLIDLSPDTVGLTDIADPQLTTGGDSETVTPTDNEGLTDSRVYDQGKAHTDNLGVTDSRAYEQGKARTDNLGLTDDADVVHDSVIDASADTLGLSDTATRTLGRDITATDTLGLTDSVTTETSKAVTAADTETLTDQAATVGVFARSVTDTLGLTDSVSVSGDRTLAATDTEQLTDQASTVGVFARSATDTLGLTDSVTTDVGKLVTVTDTEGLTDSRTLEQGKGRTDNLGLVDSLTFELIKVVADTAVLSDAVAIVAAYARTLTDDVGLADIAGSDAGLVYRLTVTSAAGPRYTAAPGSSGYLSVAGGPKHVTED